MLNRIFQLSIRNRCLIRLFTVGMAGVGILSLRRLPIGAVPDIANNPVQINTRFQACSPSETEKQVSFPIETALAGIPPLEYTRSPWRNGFSQDGLS